MTGLLRTEPNALMLTQIQKIVKTYHLKRIYAMNRKRPGRSKYLLSVGVNLIQKGLGQVVSRILVRILFVRSRAERKDWIALISTDMDISEDEIIRRYGVRWNIEVFFKTCKQHLKLPQHLRSALGILQPPAAA